LAYQIVALQIPILRILDLKIEGVQYKGYMQNMRLRIRKEEPHRLSLRKNYISLANSLTQKYQFLKLLQQFF